MTANDAVLSCQARVVAWWAFEAGEDQVKGGVTHFSSDSPALVASSQP